jgi:tetratricopeptide (TPR) repeat protein
MALCSKIGFGVKSDDQESQEWLAKCQRSDLDDAIKETAIEKIAKSYRINMLLMSGLDIELDYGYHYRISGILPTAEKQTQREIEDMEESLGRNHVAVAKLKHILASILDAKGDRVGAEEVARDLCEIQRQDGHDIIAPDLNLAIMLQHAGKFREAEELLESASDKLERKYGNNKDFMLVRLKSIQAEVFQEQGKYELAEKYAESEATYRDIVRHARQQFGPDHMETLKATSGLMTVLTARGKLQESRAMLESISEPIQNLVLDDTPEAMEVLSKVSLHYLALGRGVDAEPLIQRTTEEYRRRLRLDNPGSLAAVGHQAHALYEAGKLDEAEELYNMVIEQMLKRRDTLSADTVNNYALLLTDKGELEKAERMHRWSLEVSKTVYGESHPTTLSCLNNVGRVLMRQEKFEEAENLFRIVLDARIKLFGQDSFYTLRSFYNLAGVLLLQGKLHDAEASFRHLYESQSKNLGAHPDVLDTMRTLASLLQMNGKVAEGKAMQHRLLEESEKIWGKEHPFTQSCRNDMVRTLRIEAVAEDTQWGNYQRRTDWQRVLSSARTPSELPKQSPEATR